MTKVRAKLPWLAVGLLVFVIGAWWRWQVHAAIPSFFGPGDPAIYFGMGRGVLREGLPIQDFLHHYLTRPPEIRHLEDYYEPLFGYLVAGAMAIFGRSPQGAAGVSFLGGIFAIALVGFLARGRGLAVSAVAMAIVAFDPWSIYYSGVLMKETVVVCATLGAYVGTLHIARRQRSKWADGAFVAALVFGAGLMQYESLPILFLASGVTLFGSHRRAAVPFALTWLFLVTVLALITWKVLGVPISAKLLFIQGVHPGDPAGVAGAAVSRSTLFPLAYVLRSLLTIWYPILPLMGICGLFLPGSVSSERTWVLTYLVLHVWLHGIPHDLWNRDFIVPTALLAGSAGRALVEWRSWFQKPVLGGVAWGGGSYLWLAGSLLRFAFAQWPDLERIAPTLRLLLTLPIAIAGYFVGRSLLRSRWGSPVAAITSLMLALSLVGQFWIALPYPAISTNPQFPDFEIERARRQRVSEWMRARVPAAPVLAEHSGEVAAYSGFPTAIMPEIFERASFLELLDRYRIAYVLSRDGVVPAELRDSSRLELVGQQEGFSLHRVGARTRSGTN